MIYSNYASMFSGQFPMLQEALKRAFAQFDFDLRCAAPGIIQSFDSETQTVSVQLVIRDKIFIDKVQSIPIPILQDVPIVLPKAGDYVVTIPPKKGDECIVIFADSCIDSWWKYGEDKSEDTELRGTREAISPRRHDLSDGFAILGVWSQPNKIENYSLEGLEIRTLDGKNKVQIQTDLIKITVNENTFIEIKDGEINITTSDKLNVEAKGAVSVDAEGSVSVIGAEDITIDSDSDVTINNKGNLSINSTGDIKIVGDSTITIESTKVELGKTSLQALVNASAVDIFNAHTHTSASPGSPTSTPSVLLIEGINTTTETEAS